jgi:hypothetical protein
MNIKRILSQSFILISALSIGGVSIMALNDPQSVMDLVQVTLPNNDAFSSIRGVYGGAGFAIGISLLYAIRRDIGKALAFLMLLWGLYALARMITIFKEGPLGDFGILWIRTETALFIISCLLFFWNKRSPEDRSVS